MKANFILLFTFLLLIFSCTHTPSVIEPIPVYKCYEKLNNYLIADTNNRIITPLYVDSGPIAIDPTEWSESKYDYSYPCFNPNNSDEICFLRLDPRAMTLIYDICTFNFCTGEMRKLYNNVFDCPQWGKQNNIVFTAIDGQLWTIKANGDSLKQITDIGLNYYPSWNPKGNKIIFKKQNANGLTKSIIADVELNTFDTLNQLNNVGTYWFGETTIIRDYHNGFDVYNFNTNTLEPVVSSLDISQSKNSVIETCGRENDLYIYWCSYYNIFRTHRETLKTDTLLTSGDNGYYENISVSETGKKILFSRKNRRFKSGFIYYTIRLYLMNTDGTELKQINIPE